MSGTDLLVMLILCLIFDSVINRGNRSRVYYRKPPDTDPPEGYSVIEQ